MPISFSAEKTPPAPVLPIQISFPSQPPASAVISALVDTGSDFSLIPLRYLLPIDAPEMRSAFCGVYLANGNSSPCIWWTFTSK